jgi:hypothetical protein
MTGCPLKVAFFLGETLFYKMAFRYLIYSREGNSFTKTLKIHVSQRPHSIRAIRVLIILAIHPEKHAAVR